MEIHYTVVGRWPFPLDMLRHDIAEPATPEDNTLIKRFCQDCSPEPERMGKISVNLVMRDCGRFKPNTARWESFGWSIPADTEHHFYKAANAGRREDEHIRRVALAKLTPDERRVLGVDQ